MNVKEKTNAQLTAAIKAETMEMRKRAHEILKKSRTQGMKVIGVVLAMEVMDLSDKIIEAIRKDDYFEAKEEIVRIDPLLLKKPTEEWILISGSLGKIRAIINEMIWRKKN